MNKKVTICTKTNLKSGVTGLEGYNFDSKVEIKFLEDKYNCAKFKGRIIGGNIDIIMFLAGTKFDGTSKFINKYAKDGIIWYFDNCELSKEDLIRTLWKFDVLGYFKNTVAILFGRCGEEKSLLGYDMKTALQDSVIAKYNIPIVYDTDISHKGPCPTIINGAIAECSFKDNKGKIKFELK